MKMIFASSLIFSMLLTEVSAYGQPQQSANFHITKSVLDASGGSSASANFRLISSVGQPSPVGLQSSATFNLSGGFLSPQFMISPLSPIQDLVIMYMAPDAILHWGRQAGTQSYKIYRATDPLFTPAAGNYVGAAADTVFADVNALSLPDARYYYSVATSSDPAPALLTKSGLQEFPRAVLQMNKLEIKRSIAPNPQHRKNKE
jgi:hypothetical protein